MVMKLMIRETHEIFFVKFPDDEERMIESLAKDMLHVYEQTNGKMLVIRSEDVLYLEETDPDEAEGIEDEG